MLPVGAFWTVIGSSICFRTLAFSCSNLTVSSMLLRVRAITIWQVQKYVMPPIDFSLHCFYRSHLNQDIYCYLCMALLHWEEHLRVCNTCLHIHDNWFPLCGVDIRRKILLLTSVRCCPSISYSFQPVENFSFQIMNNSLYQLKMLKTGNRFDVCFLHTSSSKWHLSEWPLQLHFSHTNGSVAVYWRHLQIR